MTLYEKYMVLIANMFVSRVPSNMDAAVLAAVSFLNMSEDKPAEALEDSEPKPRLYSFSKDANLIFAAFRQTHGIDISTAKMHWWVFSVLFIDLGPDTAFQNLVGLRKRVKDGTASKEERAVARELGEQFEIRDLDTRTVEEREREREFLEKVQRKQT